MLTETVEISGNPECSSPVRDRLGDPTTVRALVDMLVMLIRMYHCAWLIDRSGLTLKGQFTASNFLVSDTLSVRTYQINLSRWKQTDEDQDHLAFEAAVDDFLGPEEIPVIIRQWLSLMRCGRRGYVIRYHPALIDPLQQVNWLMMCRNIFEGLRITDTRLYSKMISWLRDYRKWLQTDTININLTLPCQYPPYPSGHIVVILLSIRFTSLTSAWCG